MLRGRRLLDEPVRDERHVPQLGRLGLKLAQSLVVTPFDVMECLGRFTLRDEGKTIAIGKIIAIE